MFAPLYVVQELSARCYANCRGCFRTFVKGPFDGDMTLETFENANRGIPSETMILPNFHGESFLHPFFPVFLKRYKELGLRVSLPTSAFSGTKHLPLIVGEDSPVYIFIISIDGFSSYSHNLRRGNITLQKAEAFVDEALRLRGERKSPWISVRIVEGGQSEREMELYIKKYLFEKKLDFILRSRMFNYGSEFNSPVSLGSHKCRSLVEGNPVVLFNGDVLLCERTADREKYVLGNVNTDDWEIIMARRAKMTEGYPENDPCRLCSAAYLLTGMQGVLELRHPDNDEQKVPIYFHSDHSQSYLSLVKSWQGINWSLK